MRVYSVLLGAAALLSGCGMDNMANQVNQVGAGGIGSSMVSSLLEGACHDYLANQEVWQVAKLTLAQTGAGLADIERDVCQCASSAAAQNMTTEQQLALISPQSRQKVLLDLIAPAALSCYQRFAGRF